MRVVVIGGGITGLTATWALARAGIPTTLLESADRLGGKVRTDRVGGFLVEAGPDSFISYRPAALDLCRELGLEGDVIRPTDPRTVTIRTGGRFVRMPDGIGLVLPRRIRPFLTTPLFSPLEKLRMGLDLVMPRNGATGDMGVGPFLRRRLGPALVDRLAGPLIGGVYGTPIDELSLDAVVPQLRAAEREHRSLLLASLAEGRAAGRARRAAGESGTNGSGGSPFVSLRGGLGQLTDALAAALEVSPAATVRTGARVAGLERDGDTLDVLLTGGERLAADAVILAAPAYVAAGLLEPLAPGTTHHLRTIPHGSVGVVSLGYAENQFPKPLAGHGFLVADAEPLAIHACTWSSAKWPGRAPEGSILARVFMRADGSSMAVGTDEELADLAHRDLVATMGVRGRPTLVRVDRWDVAMPHYTIGHLDRVAAIEAGLGGLPNVVLAGAAYRGVGLPDCIAQGRAAALRIQELLAGMAGPGGGSFSADEAPEVRPTSSESTSMPLSGATIGEIVQVTAVRPEFAEELSHEGIHDGVNLSITVAAPLGGPLVVRVGAARVAVARSVADTIHVVRLAQPGATSPPLRLGPGGLPTVSGVPGVSGAGT